MTRVTPTEAMNLRCQHGAEPMQAAADLTTEIYTRMALRVWCNDTLIKPHIRPDIRIVAQREDDGRWTANVESISKDWAGNQYRWALEDVDVAPDERVSPHLQRVMDALSELPEMPFKEAENKLKPLGLKLSRQTWNRARKKLGRI